jgi:hypothetical protein
VNLTEIKLTNNYLNEEIITSEVAPFASYKDSSIGLKGSVNGIENYHTTQFTGIGVLGGV